MGSEKRLKRRFCWPAQDRVRAIPFFAAPRIPPVFSASDSFPSHLVPRAPLVASSSSTPCPSSRLNRGAAGRHGGSRSQRSSCCVIDKPGRVPCCREFKYRSFRRSKPFHAVINGNLNSRQRGLAPDWRILGEQDIAAES